MKRVIRENPIRAVIAISVIAVIACSGFWAAWSSEKRRNTQLNELFAERLADKEAERERAWHNNVELMAANAYLLRSVVWHTQVAGNEGGKAAYWRKKAREAQGHWGQLKRKNNQLQRKNCALEQMLRDNGVRLYMKSECEGSK